MYKPGAGPFYLKRKLFAACTAKAACAAGRAGKVIGFFKRRVQGGQNHQLRNFLPGFKHKFAVV